MSTIATAEKLMTLEEFLAIPDDGVERWLIRGQLREKRDTDMTKRNRFHSITEGRVSVVLGNWLLQQPVPRGEVVCGEAGFILTRSPDSAAGIDVAYISPAMADSTPADTTMFDGPPVLAAEILSPNDTQQEVAERIMDYIAAGVRLVWVIDPYFRTVRVHEPGQPLRLYNPGDTLTGGSVLPGFSCRVADFFR